MRPRSRSGSVGITARKSPWKMDAAELCPPGEERERSLFPGEARVACVAPSS